MGRKYHIITWESLAAYAHTNWGKLDARAIKGVFIGCPKDVKGYKLWCFSLKPPKCIISSDVNFYEGDLLDY